MLMVVYKTYIMANTYLEIIKWLYTNIILKPIQEFKFNLDVCDDHLNLWLHCNKTAYLISIHGSEERVNTIFTKIRETLKEEITVEKYKQLDYLNYI